MHKAQTRQWIKRAQIGAVVLLLAAGAMAVMPGSWTGAGAPAAPRISKPRQVASSATAFAVNTAELAGRLANISMPMPKDKPPPPPPPPPPAPTDQPHEEPSPVTAWEYIGGIIGPSLRKAVVTVAGDKRMVSEGDVVADAKVLAITSDFIVLDEKGEERRIDRKQKTDRLAMSGGGSAIAAGKNGKSAAGAGAGGAGAAGAGSGMDAAAVAAAAARARAGGPTGAAAMDPRLRKLAKDRMDKEVKGAAPGEGIEPMNDKTRRIFAEIMRTNGGVPPSPEMLAKYGLGRIEPNDDDMAIIHGLIEEQAGH